MFGGLFSISDVYFNYWSELANALKFGSLLAAFLLLIFLAYRRLERDTSPQAARGEPSLSHKRIIRLPRGPDIIHH